MVARSLIFVGKKSKWEGICHNCDMSIFIYFLMTFVCLCDVPAVVSEEEMGDRLASLIHSN